MARIKKEAEEIPEKSLQITNVEEAQVIEENNDKTENTEEAPEIISDNIDRILKMYPEYEELYIDNKGGAYTSQYPNTQLYQNPYHKK